MTNIVGTVVDDLYLSHSQNKNEAGSVGNYTGQNVFSEDEDVNEEWVSLLRGSSEKDDLKSQVVSLQKEEHERERGVGQSSESKRKIEKKKWRRRGRGRGRIEGKGKQKKSLAERAPQYFTEVVSYNTVESINISGRRVQLYTDYIREYQFFSQEDPTHSADLERAKKDARPEHEDILVYIDVSDTEKKNGENGEDGGNGESSSACNPECEKDLESEEPHEFMLIPGEQEQGMDTVSSYPLAPFEDDKLSVFRFLDVTSHVPATFNKVVTIATDTAKDISRAHEKDVEKISRAAGTARHVYSLASTAYSVIVAPNPLNIVWKIYILADD